MLAPYRQLGLASYNGWRYAFAVNLGDPAEGNPGWNDGDHNLGVIEAWCEEQFGPQRQHEITTAHRWTMYGWTFVFHSLSDAIAFKMRWC
ncbi:MAG: hypothetical protein EOO77_34780 [Oxalobacteraceae bacterium]|nr:MAG: hypothetical protein EOO77_34780 [Oxalobacteraceae bacterium]